MPQRKPHADADADCDRNRHAGFNSHGAEQPGEGKRGADRKIDAAGNDDQRHAERHDVDDGGLAGDAGKIDGGQKMGRRNGESR